MEATNPIPAAFRILNEGGVTMYVILACSIALISLVLERFHFFWKMSIDYEWMLAQLSAFVEGRKMSEALQFCKQTRGGLARVCETALLRSSRPRKEMEDAMESTVSEELLGFDRNLPHMGTLAVVSPFIGLLGTVLGIMRAFQDIALKGAAGPAVVSKGVAEALTATAAGLFVAIPASFFYNYFRNRTKVLGQQMRITGSRLAEMLSLAQSDQPPPADR